MSIFVTLGPQEAEKSTTTKWPKYCETPCTDMSLNVNVKTILVPGSQMVARQEFNKLELKCVQI